MKNLVVTQVNKKFGLQMTLHINIYEEIKISIPKDNSYTIQQLEFLYERETIKLKEK